MWVSTSVVGCGSQLCKQHDLLHLKAPPIFVVEIDLECDIVQRGVLVYTKWLFW